MKILLTGATGFVGSELSARLERAGHRVLVVSRRSGAPFDWSQESLRRGVQAADAVCHLAGENLAGKRWTEKQKQVLWTSRSEPTRRLASLCAEKGSLAFVSTSAVGYYGPSDSATFVETSPAGSDFLAELCRAWEDACEPAVDAGLRTVILRVGIVLGKGGGALQKMLTPFRMGVGGPLGNGRQWMSWVHLDDLCALYQKALEEPALAGVYNAVAPEPVTMNEFARTLGQVLHRPAFFRVPAPLVRLALGEIADVLVSGQRVAPERTLAAGFAFRHPRLRAALDDVLGARAAQAS